MEPDIIPLDFTSQSYPGFAAAADPSVPVIRFVTATRREMPAFIGETMLGRTLFPHCGVKVELSVATGNADGLPAVYNRAIEAARDRPAILVFAHDDVALPDFFWDRQIRAAMDAFDIAGVAGNRRRLPRQPSWAYIDEAFTHDARENLSGVVGHGAAFPGGAICPYGVPGQAVKLLDGVLIMVRSETLIASGLRFDERFSFHFYDLDFCREADARGLTMGAWPLSTLHASRTGFTSDLWRESWKAYLDKWGD